MSEARDFSRLWRLVDDSLSPYTKLELAWLSKEKEREILLALSQVFREVQLWNQEVDTDFDNDSENEFSALHRSNSEEIHSLSLIVADLVYLMAVDSQYVRHLAGNVLLVVSEFVAQCGSYWEAFIRFLCVSLDLAISTLLSNSSTPLSSGANDCNGILSSLILALKDKLKIANWFALAAIVRVLCCILKHLAIEDDGQLTSVYFDSVNSCLLNVHWNSLGEIFKASDSGARKSSVEDGSLESFVFLGKFIQWLCSLLDHSRGVEASGNSKVKHSICSLTVVLVPKLLIWCPGENGDCVNKCVVQYFRHKLLVLMIRISFQTSLDCSILVSWLRLLWTYFGDILQQPITSLESAQNDSLEGSPFLSSISDEEVNSLSALHIERRAIFLFLRCSFSLISSKCDTIEKCTCRTQNLHLPSNSNVELECCGRKRGLIELKNWLQWQLPSDMFLNQEIYLQKCVDFSLSFLQLFMHEDDLLFRVLLELLSVPFPSEKEFQNDKTAFQDAEHDILSHVSKLFNHVHLFHLFLAELHYDHQVLLDYLISKDTGIICAEYLLRCLRAVCDSRRTFVGFSVRGEPEYQPSHKKRKLIREDSASQTLCEASSLPLKSDKAFKKSGAKQYLSTGRLYSKARQCLLSLLLSVESLHQKNLFPYNPKVLLKRLRTFQEHCFELDQNYP